MIYIPGLLLALAAFWFALSGETSPLFLMLGALSVLLTLWLALRLKIVDRDASPYHRAPNIMIYGGWLLVEIVKANAAVIRRIVGSSHAIDPVMVNVTTTARTDLGRALFANSITLTPGTIAVEVEPGRFLVHALTREGAAGLAGSEMDRRCAALESS